MQRKPPDGSQQVSLWHGQTDTLPRLRRTAGGVGAIIAVGVASSDLWAPTIDIDFKARVTGWDGEKKDVHPDQIEVRPLTRESIRARTKLPHAGPVPIALTAPYVDVQLAMARCSANRYVEYVLTGLAEGGRLDYTISAESRDANARVLATTAPQSFALQLVVPEFTGAHIRDVLRDDSRGARGVVMVTDDDHFVHLRVDLLACYPDGIARPLPSIVFNFTDLDSPTPGHLDAAAPLCDAEMTAIDWLPIVDTSADSVVLSVPRHLLSAATSVRIFTNGATDEGAPFHGELTLAPLLHHESTWLTARLLLLNYCIQGCNDLFSAPLTAYDPPRTYMQVTMRDEKAHFCSRPESSENHDPDGYALTLDAHRYYGVKSQWFFNAGVLLMMARDCPDEVLKIRADLGSGLLLAGNAGFGAHRPPYFKRDTNLRELEAGATTIRSILWGPGADLPDGRDPRSTYYPDQRLFENTDAEREAYAAAGVRYLVIDRSTACVYTDAAKSGQVQRFPNIDDGTNTDGNHLWTLTDVGNATALLIEDRMRDGLQGQSPEEMARGQCSYALRELFMAGVVAAGPPVVFTYGDDADKASGCGWFDGDYAGAKIHFERKYEATLCWIAGHPWLESVTTADLDGLERSGSIELASATCPSVDPDGWTSVDAYGQHLHFDQWHDRWDKTEALWLGTTLGLLKTELEDALVSWSGPNNELVELAWLYFQMCTHESFWNKEPLEHSESVNALCGVLEPEDFVVSESLQQRNAWVYLNAAVWAEMAGELPENHTHVDDGPVIDSIRTQQSAAGPGPGCDPAGLFWDHDLMPNVVLYNRHALAVFDRNGAALTHLFVMVDGRPVSVSGTFAAFQYMDTSPDGRVNDSAAADGVVMQNTVYTPNHAYIGTDVNQAQAFRGTNTDPRRPNVAQVCLYPNNFNEYAATAVDAGVEFTHQPGIKPPAKLDLDSFTIAIEADRVARLAAFSDPGSSADGPIVWHEPGTPAFTKRMELHGRRIVVRYQDVPPGHLVSNEISIDLFRIASYGLEQHVLAGADDRSITVVSDQGLAVRFRLGDNCRFRSPALSATVGGSKSAPADLLGLRRALSDDVQILCAAGGDFDYSIELPGHS